MKNIYRFTVIFLILFPVLLSAEAPQVSIYTEAEMQLYGQSLNRSRQLTVNLSDFISTGTSGVEGGGVQTAVLVDARVKNALDTLLKNRDSVLVDNSVITKTEAGGEPAYGFLWKDYGFEIIFSLEKADKEIAGIIERTYARDAYLLGELRRSYTDNYAVKVFKAEDVLSPRGKIDFQEVMLCATVIGDSFQPLLGIHDGLGVLNDLGIVTARVDVITEDSLVEYRQPEFAENELRAFIHSITGMQGDFVDNLYTTVSGIWKNHSDDGKILLPEEFFLLKEGDDTDFSIFYYDVLKRAGYQVKLIVIDPGESDNQLFTTVFFKERGTDLWGRIDGTVLEREKASKIGRLPALVFSASVKYFEPDINLILGNSVIQLPPPSMWQTSLY